MNALAIAALVTWLVAGALDLYLLSPWLGDKSGIFSQAALLGHLALGLCGLASWIRFVLTGSAHFAWLAIALLGPAIGLGISIFGTWVSQQRRRADAARNERPQPAVFGFTSDEMLARALEDEALTTKLVDDLLASVLARPKPGLPGPVRRATSLIAATQATLAMITLLVAILAAVTAG